MGRAHCWAWSLPPSPHKVTMVPPAEGALNECTFAHGIQPLSWSVPRRGSLMWMDCRCGRAATRDAVGYM
eukprot:7375377-Prymnesium_polylepis.1